MHCLKTMEYYSTFNRKEILTHVDTWKSLEDFMLSKMKQGVVVHTFNLSPGAAGSGESL